MAFEENKFYVAKRCELDKSNFNVECNISLGQEVNKILTVSLEKCIQNIETLNGSLNYSGVIDAKIVFLTNDNQINTVCSTCPFSSKFENDEIMNGSNAVIHLKIIDYSIENVNLDNIRLSVLIEQSGMVFCSKEVKTIRTDDEFTCCKEDEISIIKYIGSTSENFEVESEINVREKIKKILLTESKALIKNIESNENFVTVSGDIVSRILYIDENDKFESGYINDSFKQEIELNGVNSESLIEGDIFVKYDSIFTEIKEDEKGSIILIKNPLMINIRAFQEEKISVISDLYSVKNDIQVTTESFCMSKVCESEFFEEKIEGSLILDEEKPRVDKILFTGGNSVTITNQYLKDNEVYIEGIAKTTVVYLNDENSSFYSAQIDVPFEISDKTKFEGDGVLFVDALVCDVDVSVKKGRELFYDSKIKACINYCSDKCCAIISDAVNGENYEEKDYAMEVIFAGEGDTLWDIAKKNKVKEEQVLQQNPDITFPLSQDSSLILFYQKLN